MTRIGILGVAHMHVDAYIGSVRAAGADIVGAYDRDGERGMAWCQRRDVRFFADITALLDAALDGVIICSETAFHRQLAEYAAQAGIGVLCEKPLGVGREDSADIVSACERAGVVLMTAFPMRFHPAVARVHRLVSDGALGRLRAFTGNNQSVMPLQERSWFADKRLAGGGAMMDHIVHLADVFSWIAGSAPVSVYAVANRIMHADVVTVETGGLVMMTFPDGSFASMDCSWSRPLSYPSFGEARFSVVGDLGTVEVNPLSQRLTQFGGSRPFGWVPWGPGINQMMIDEFLAAIRDQRRPTITGTDGLIATLVAVAAMESAQTGQPVPVKLRELERE